jgi:hypothetical protein
VSETAGLIPSPQELSALPAAVLATEITNIEALLASRYAPGGTEALLADEIVTRGRAVKLACWADITRYRANLYLASGIQAAEASTGGIGLIDVEIVGGQGRDGGFNDNGWSW